MAEKSPFWTINSGILRELEQYLQELNYPKIERLARRQYRHKAISEAQHDILFTLGDLQERIFTADYSSFVDESHVLVIPSDALERPIRNAIRAIQHAKLDLDKLGKYLDAFQKAFDNLTLDDIKWLLTIPEEDFGVPGCYLAHLVGLQAGFMRGIGLEYSGKFSEALLQFSELTDFCRRYPNPAVLKSPGFVYFSGMSIYRYGLLCSNLAENTSSITNDGDTEQFRSRLLYDAVISFRMFLTFKPSSFGKSLHISALRRYMIALQGRFRRYNYRKSLDPEKFIFTAADTQSKLFFPENISEDLIICTQLLENMVASRSISKKDVQIEASSFRVKKSLSTLINNGDSDGALCLAKSLFKRYAADASTYARLMFAAIGAGRYDEAFRAGQIYIEIGGCEPSVILIFSKLCLIFKSHVELAVSNLVKLLDNPKLADDIKVPLQINLGLSYLVVAHLPSNSASRKQLLDQAMFQLRSAISDDESNHEGRTLLALALAIDYSLRDAEEMIKSSLSLEPDQPLAWFLFAQIRCAQSDYESAIAICDGYLESILEPNILIHILKSAILGHLGLWDRAAHCIGVLISSYTTPSGPVIENTTEIFPGSSNSSNLEKLGNKNIDPAQFRSHFYSGVEEFAASMTNNSALTPPPAQDYKLTMSSYKDGFPLSPSSVITSKLLKKSSLFPGSVIQSSELLHFMERLSLINPHLPFSKILLSQQLWCILGEIHVSNTQFNFAELCEHEAFLLNELSSNCYVLKGHIFERQNDFENALDCFQLAQQMDTENIEALMGLVRCYCQKDIHNNLILALNLAMQAIKIEPWNHRVIATCVDICRQLNMDEEAKKYFDQLLEIEDQEPLIPFSYLLNLFVAQFFNTVL